MKLVYCIDHLRRDGTQRVLEQLVRGLSRNGHRQAVLCLNDANDRDVVEALNVSGAHVRVIGRRALAVGSGILAAFRWLRRERFDAMITLLFASDVLGRTLAHLAGVPRIITSIRARNIHYRPWQRRLVRMTMRWADAVVLNTVTTRQFAITEEGARPDRILVIPNGIDVDDSNRFRDPAGVRCELGVAPGTPLIGSVGRLTRQKGYDVLLRAMASAGPESSHLLLIGEGEDKAALQHAAAAAGLAERVHLLGRRTDVPRLLSALDCYVQPSRFEGMPNALLEALAVGTPVVATAVDGNQELVVDGLHGWLVPPEDAKSLATAIRSALEAPAEARRRALAGRERVAREFSLERMISAWEGVLVDGRSVSPDAAAPAPASFRVGGPRDVGDPRPANAARNRHEALPDVSPRDGA